MHAIPFDPPGVAAFVAEHRPWSPFALAALYHTLLAHFRGDTVDRAFHEVHPVLSEGSAR